MSGNLEFMSGSQRKPESFAKGFLKFTGLSALAGLLGLALLAPTALVGGFAASAGITIFENLPDYIKPVNASQASTLYATQDGQPVEVAKFYHQNRISVNYDQMSVNMRNAVIATEDPRYFQHAGVDIVSFVRAAFGNVVTAGGGAGHAGGRATGLRSQRGPRVMAGLPATLRAISAFVRGLGHVLGGLWTIHRVFPQLAGVPIEFSWGGHLDISMQRTPDIGGADNRYWLQGYSGHGVLPTLAGARAVADAILGNSDELALYQGLRNPRFPGGELLAAPLEAVGKAWYRLRDFV